MTPCLCTNRTTCRFYQHLHNSRLSETDLQHSEDGRKKRIYKRGAYIFEQGRNSTGLYCVQSGHVLLKHLDKFGNETAFRVVGPGELMGQRSFFGKDNHMASGQALSRTYICFHPKAVVDQLLNTSVHLARCFLHDLARDPGPADTLKLRNLKLPLRIRLIYLLVILKEHSDVTSHEGSLTFNLPLKRLDIAALISARPESVTRVIRDMETDGIALFHDHTVTVPHLDKLLEIIGSNLESPGAQLAEGS